MEASINGTGLAATSVIPFPNSAPAPVKNPRGRSGSATPISIAQVRRLMAAEEERKHRQWVEEMLNELATLERRAGRIRRLLAGTEGSGSSGSV